MGPNQAMNHLYAWGPPAPASDPITATGRATSSAKAMKATSATTESPYPRPTITAPKTKKVRTWKIVLTFSLKSTKRSVISCSA